MSAASMFGDIAGGVGSNLTTSYENQAQQASVMGRRSAAAYGLMGKALDKATGQIAGMTMGMGISNEAATAGVANFERYKDVMKAVGLTSGLTAAKLADLGIVNVDQLAQGLNSAKKELHATDSEMLTMSKSFTGLGKHIGNVKLAFDQMNDVLLLAKNRENLAAQGFSKIKGTKVADSIADAAAMFHTMGANAEDAVHTAILLEKTLQSDAAGMRNMFAGVQSDMGTFVEGFSIISGDFEQAWASMEQGPDQFIKNMSRAMVKLKQSGGNVGQFLGHLEAQLGRTSLGEKGAAQIVRTLSGVNEANLKMIETTRMAGDSLGKITDQAWRSTKTLQDQFELAMGAGVASFRNIGRAAAVAFVKDAAKSFSDFNKQMADWANNDDLKGMIVKKMSEVSNIGFAALLPENWRGGFAVFGEMYKQISPVLGQVTQLAGAVGALANPLTLVAGLAGLFVSKVVAAKTPLKSWGQAMHEAYDSFKETLGEWKDKLISWADEIPWSDIAASMAKGMADILLLLSQMLDDTHGVLTDPSQGKASQLASKIFGAFKEAFAAYNWSGLFSNLWTQTQTIREDIQKKILEFLKGTLGAMTPADWQWVGQKISDGFVIAVKFAKDVLVANAEFSDTLAEVFRAAAKTAIVAAFKAVFSLDTVRSAMGIFGAGLDIISLFWPKGTTEKLGAETKPGMEAMGSNYHQTMKDMAEDTKKHFGNSIVPDMFAKGIKEMVGEMPKLTKASDEITKAMANHFKMMWIFILEDTKLAMDGISGEISGSVNELAKLREALANIKEAKDLVKGGSEGQKYKQTGEDKDTQLLQLTAWPEWYQKDYKQLFKEGVAQIVTAVGSNKTITRTGATAAGAQEQLRNRGTETLGLGPGQGGGPNK